MTPLDPQTPPLWLQAIATAARVHQGQLRKDGRTPYASHVFRVALLVRDQFGIGDPEVLAAAVLHDTIEDTATDFDDIAADFGPRVAAWVAALTKNKALAHEQRETLYADVLRSAPWQVQLCKLADILDNLVDSAHLSCEGREKSLINARRYLAALQEGLQPEAAAAWRQVASYCAQLGAT